MELTIKNLQQPNLDPINPTPLSFNNEEEFWSYLNLH